MSDADIDLSVIIVSWNVKDLLRDCLGSIQRTMPSSLRSEIFVVDNASRDGSPEMVARTFSDVELIANEENRGFGPANNQALRRCRGRYVLLINPDTVVPNGAIGRMVDFMREHPRAGLIGPELMDGKGRLLINWVRWTPRQMIEFLIESLASLGRSEAHILFPQPRRVPILTGACWMVRREAMTEIGLYDEDLFMYAEEPDVCTRMRDAGWEIWFLREVTIRHYKRESIRQRGLFVEAWLFLRSMAIWIGKRWKLAVL